LLRLESYNPPGCELGVASAVVEQALAWGLSGEFIPLSETRANLVVSLPDESAGPTVQAFQTAASSALGRPTVVRGASYYTDASVLQPATGVPTVIFGPGDDRLAHQPNEHVEVSQVTAAADCYAAFVREVLSRADSR
jgi:acetylornithine deacetylase/succinyl-diaminopimelate desuccinylase-like protein